MMDRESRVGVVLVRGADLKPQPVSWLWESWLARGKLHLITGAPSTGKTTIAMTFAATITKGGEWPDGTRAEIGRVLVWSGEDSAADTLVPRLMAAGADLNRVEFATEAMVGGDLRPFDPSRDCDALVAEAAQLPDLRLVIIDPIVSVVRGDTNKNGDVRRGLQPLIDLAERTGCAVLGITHDSKGAAGRSVTDRVTGSLAFGAAARVVMATAKVAGENGGGRVITRSKSNHGPEGGGFSYDVAKATTVFEGQDIDTSRISWGLELSGSASEILAKAEMVIAPEERSALDEASEFLVEILENGPMTATEVRAAGEAAGHAFATLRRASRALGIKPSKGGMTGPWQWELPPKMLKATEDAHTNTMSTFVCDEHLRGRLPSRC